MENCFLKAVTLMFLLLPFFVFIIRSKKKLIIISLFKELIYKRQNDLHKLTMWTLIIWHNRFSENENEVVETYIPRHLDSKTKKPRHRDSKNKKPGHRDPGTKTPRHRETETTTPRHRDSKALFQRTASHDIEIPRLKNHDIEILRPKSDDIEFLWNSDPYAP